MNIPDILLMSVKGLSERKFRFTLNLIGILIGCLAVTGLISMTQGLNDLVGTQLDQFGPNNVMLLPNSPMGGTLIASESFNWKDVEIVERTSNVEMVSPLIAGKVASFTQQGEKRYAFVYGVSSNYFEIMSGWEVEEGRYLSRSDSAVVLLGHEIANPKDPSLSGFTVGDRISLQVSVDGESKEMTFRVVGIMEKNGGIGGMSSDEDQSVFMPLRTCQQLYEEGGEYQYIMARVSTTDDVPQVVADLEASMGEDVNVMTSDSMSEMAGTILGAIEAVLGGVAGISLLVAGVGIVNTMTISVMERTKEIGIMKAIGSNSTDILLLFLSEAIMTGFLGGAIGAIGGLALGQVVGKSIDMPVSSSPTLALGVIVFAIIITSLAGLYPAWRASSMHPVEALRSE